MAPPSQPDIDAESSLGLPEIKIAGSLGVIVATSVFACLFARFFAVLEYSNHSTGLDRVRSSLAFTRVRDAINKLFDDILLSTLQVWPGKQVLHSLLSCECLSGLLGGLEESSTSPPGLGNWDNSCYQNSVLQALASLEPFHVFLCTTKQQGTEQPQPEVWIALLNLIDDLNRNSNRCRRLWTPKALKRMDSLEQQDAQEYFSKIIDLVEQDIHKSLEAADRAKHSRGLAMSLDCSLNVNTDEDQTEARDPTYASSQLSRLSRARELSSYSNPLEGLLAQRVGCTSCGYVDGISAVPFNCLTLPLGPHARYQLRDRLNEFTTMEAIQGVDCGKCSLLRARGYLQEEISQTFVAPADCESSEDDSTTKEQATPQLIGSLQHLDSQLAEVEAALSQEDFSEHRLSSKCNLPSCARVASIKSSQLVVLRAPKCLVIHLNRSLFDSSLGIQRKNYAKVSYDAHLDLSPWCLGAIVGPMTGSDLAAKERWNTNPREPMLSKECDYSMRRKCRYELRAVVTHHGRHENGHYVCYKRINKAPRHSSKTASSWWRFSDDRVSSVSEQEVLSIEDAFMLFYERLDPT